MSKVITRSSLVSMLKEYVGVVFANVTYKVDEGKSRTVNGKKVLQKQVTVNVTLNSNYERKVNRILEKKQGEQEPNFEAKEMYGSKLAFPETACKCIVESEKTGKLRLYAIVENQNEPHTVYFHNGNPIDFEDAKRLDLFAPSFFAEKKTAGRGEVSEENDFGIITPGIDKIVALTIGGENYIIQGD